MKQPVCAMVLNVCSVEINRMLIALVCLLCIAYGGNAQAGDSFHLDKSALIAITESGVDGAGSRACRQIRLNEAEVRAFFSKAQAITEQEAREEYRRAPCFVRGNVTVGKETYAWEIRAYGTATVTLPNGATMRLGDPERRRAAKRKELPSCEP